jgi:hypothetical protein
VNAGHGQGCLGHVDAGYLATAGGQGLGEQSTPAAHVEYLFSIKAGAPIVDIGQPHRIDVVQGLERAVPVPPDVGHGRKTGDFATVDVVV